jgi:hypothetical protein
MSIPAASESLPPSASSVEGKRIAVEVVDVYGNESTVVKDLNGK